MSGAAGPFTELLWAGPSASWPAAAAASVAAQPLMTGASGLWEQPFIPANWWQMGRRNQRLRIELGGVLTGQSSATTAIWTVGLATASNTIVTGAVTLAATPALTVTSFAAAGWRMKVDLLSRNVGYGTTTVSTSLLGDGEVSIGTLGSVAPQTLVTTVDCSAQSWVFASITFSTSSATNSCQLTRADVWGLN